MYHHVHSIYLWDKFSCLETATAEYVGHIPVIYKVTTITYSQ